MDLSKKIKLQKAKYIIPKDLNKFWKNPPKYCRKNRKTNSIYRKEHSTNNIERKKRGKDKIFRGESRYGSIKV